MKRTGRMNHVIKCKPTPKQFLDIRSKSRYRQCRGHLSFGRASGIPLCCCIEWIVRLYVLRQKDFGIKLCGPDCYSEFVHCSLHRLRYRREHKRLYQTMADVETDYDTH